jgi:hypothetical protein
MDWHLIIGILAGVIQVASIIPYVKSMLHGTTRPSVVTNILWTIIQIIVFAAQLSAGASWSIIIIIALIFNSSLVTVLCFKGYGYKKYGPIDIICFLLAILAIVLWQLTNDPTIAIILSIIADFIATLPTLIKTYRDPHSESVFPWALTLVGSALGALSSTKIDFANLAFPVYMLFVDSSITGFAFFGRRRKTKL